MASTSVESDANPNSIEAKVERSRNAVAATVEYITEHRPSVRLRQSPIAALLQDRAGEIREALDAGWTAGAIARVLHERGMKFSPDSVRLRIAKMFATKGETAPSAGAGKPLGNTEKRKAAKPVMPATRVAETKAATAPVGPAKPVVTTNATHAAFDEDPR